MIEIDGTTGDPKNVSEGGIAIYFYTVQKIAADVLKKEKTKCQ